MYRNSIFHLLAAVPMGLLASAAAAQPAEPGVRGADSFGDIVVTAQKRAENLQDVPIAITAISGDQLAQRQIRAADDLVTSVPSLQVNAVLGKGIPIFSLRGISMSDFSLAQNGPIAVYYDEVYKGNPAILGLGLYDLERVEVLKGPQGTLYGKNTTGGAVNLVSRRPTFQDEASLSVGYGNFKHFSADGAVEAELGDGLGARVAFTYDRSPGWVKNLYPGAPDGNGTRQYGIRGSFRYQDDTVDVTIRASTSLQNPWGYGAIAVIGEDGIGAGLYAGSPYEFRQGLGKREIYTDDLKRRRLKSDAVAVNLDVTLSDAMTVTSITSWDRGSINYSEDPDGTPLQQGMPDYVGTTRQITQDLRLTSSYDGPFNFILGGFYSHEKIFNSTSIGFFTDLELTGDGVIDADDCVAGGYFLTCNVLNRFDQAKESFAAYSDVTFEVSDALTLRGGLRYTHDRGKLRNFLGQIRSADLVPILNTIPGDPDNLYATASQDFRNNNISGKVGIDYKPADDILLYASVSRGFRGSAFSGQAFFGPEELTIARPETLTAVEAGFKTELFDRLVRLNGSFYWYGYKNQQFLSVDPTTTQNSLVNLPKSRIIGAEFDLQIRPTSNLTLSSGVGILHSKVQTGIINGENVAGNRLISAPEFTLTSAIDWSIPLGTEWFADARADVAHSSGIYFDIVNSLAAYDDGYTLVNARVRLRPAADNYGIALWVKNITNEYYHTAMIDASGVGYSYTHVNAPRTYGVTLDVKF